MERERVFISRFFPAVLLTCPLGIKHCCNFSSMERLKNSFSREQRMLVIQEIFLFGERISMCSEGGKVSKIEKLTHTSKSLKMMDGF